MAVSEEDKQRMYRIIMHAAQVQDGLIPPDSPPDFTVPQPLDSRGLPWFFGPDYHPTDGALAEFSKGSAQPEYGNLVYDDGTVIRQKDVPPFTGHAVEISYDDMPPFHEDDIAAIRARLGLLDEDE